MVGPSLTTDYACGRDRTNMGGNIPVTVCRLNAFTKQNTFRSTHARTA